MSTEDLQLDAQLLLEHAIGKMSGREIDVCEKFATGDFAEQEAFVEEHSNDEDELNALAEEDLVAELEADRATFLAFRAQFISELAEWRKGVRK